ncbi:pyridoxamine 5'-phosphate oxidase-domain-containing protein [Pelagophyceae sp. CCMP2097]|nr:pyridoxamine 5'-phosphate oxidase-domain-containing protein [Pelagophyceae sp. CCMP2097]
MRVLRLVSFLAAAAAEPRFFNKAEYARWLASRLGWGTLATTSTAPGTEGWPFANPVSYSEAHGIPYMCVSGLDASIQDIQKDARCSLALSEAQLGEDKCNVTKSGDAESPLCARLVLSGTFIKLENTTKEWSTAKDALEPKHPAMAGWGCFNEEGPSGHGFFLAKIDIKQAWLINMYGGAAVLTAEEYFAAERPAVA